MKNKQIVKKYAFALNLLLALFLFGCTHKREGEVVMGKDGNYYELTTQGMVSMPDEAYRLRKIDTAKYDVKAVLELQLIEK